eukprot:1159279-Pelagomonas_calceolata.AAC.20
MRHTASMLICIPEAARSPLAPLLLPLLLQRGQPPSRPAPAEPLTPHAQQMQRAGPPPGGRGRMQACTSKTRHGPANAQPPKSRMWACVRAEQQTRARCGLMQVQHSTVPQTSTLKSRTYRHAGWAGLLQASQSPSFGLPKCVLILFQ